MRWRWRGDAPRRRGDAPGRRRREPSACNACVCECECVCVCVCVCFSLCEWVCYLDIDIVALRPVARVSPIGCMHACMRRLEMRSARRSLRHARRGGEIDAGLSESRARVYGCMDGCRVMSARWCMMMMLTDAAIDDDEARRGWDRTRRVCVCGAECARMATGHVVMMGDGAAVRRARVRRQGGTRRHPARGEAGFGCRPAVRRRLPARILVIERYV